MTTVHATAPSGAQRSEFIPYVYGAASGWPSRGRPELVLANPDLPETAVRLLDREPYTAPGVGGRPRTKGHGTPAAMQRHYRAREALCPECRAPNAGHGAARSAADAVRLQQLEGELAARGVVAAEDAGLAPSGVA